MATHGNEGAGPRENEGGNVEKGRSIVLDLKDLTLVSRDAISFLERGEADGVTLRNCAAYVREWITRQRGGS
jgi:hypothetical protein